MRKFMFLIGGLLFAQSQPLPPGMRCPQRTLVIFEPGPNAEKAREIFPQHASYMLQQMKSGKILAAGPMTGDQAAALFNVTRWDEVAGILKDEPFVRNGVLKIARHDVWNACEAAP